MQLNTLLTYEHLENLKAALQHFFDTQTPTTIFLYVKVPTPTHLIQQALKRYDKDSLQTACDDVVKPIKESLKSNTHITWIVRGSAAYPNYSAYVTQTIQPTLNVWQKIGQFFGQKPPQTTLQATHKLPTFAPALRVQVEDSTESHTINEVITTIGRVADINVSNNSLVSRHHAQLVFGQAEIQDARGRLVQQAQWYIEDLSAHGIWINGIGINKDSHKVKNGDVIQLGGKDAGNPKLVVTIDYTAIPQEEQRTINKASRP